MLLAAANLGGKGGAPLRVVLRTTTTGLVSSIGSSWVDFLRLLLLLRGREERELEETITEGYTLRTSVGSSTRGRMWKPKCDSMI